MTSALDSVWEWYQYARASVGAAARLVEKDPGAVPENSPLARAPQRQTLERLRGVRLELDDLAVLALFAVFERSILDHLCSTSGEIEETLPVALHRSLAAKGLEDVDRWRLDDVLDVYKVVVDSELVGQVKQVKEYRDWVAHGSRKAPPPGQVAAKLPPARIDPRSAYERLRGFLTELPGGPSVPAG